MKHPFQFAWLVAGLAFFLGVPGARAVSYLPGSDAKWRVYRSPHFELFSQASEANSRGFVHKMELLHALFYGCAEETLRQPKELTIYYFKSRRDYIAYVPPPLQHNAGAVFQGGADRSLILLAEDSIAEDSQAVLNRAYIHHLFDLAEERPTPWYRAGMAEFFCTMEVKGDKLLVGRANGAMLRELQAKPFPALTGLFEVPAAGTPRRYAYDRGEVAAEGAAQAWALIHYFNAANAGLDPRQLAKFEAYLRAARERYDAAKAAEAFRELCGIDYASLQARLNEYVRHGRYRLAVFEAPGIPPASSYAQEEVDPQRIALRLGELQLRTTRSAIGKQQVLAAATRNPPETRALEALGNDALADNDVTRACEYWQRAIDAGSTNPALYRELARVASARWFQQFDYDFRLSEERVGELRALLAKSIAIAPNQQAAYALLAWVEASAPTVQPANLTLIQQQFADLGEKRPSTLLAIAVIYAHRRQTDEAGRLLDRLVEMDPAPDILNCVQIVRARLAHQAKPEANQAAPEGGAPD